MAVNHRRILKHGLLSDLTGKNNSTLETSKMLKRTHLIKVRTETVRKLKTLMAQMGNNGLNDTIETVIRITEAPHRGSLREFGWDTFPEGRRG